MRPVLPSTVAHAQKRAAGAAGVQVSSASRLSTAFIPARAAA